MQKIFRNSIVLFVLVAAMFVLIGCGNSESTDGYTQISSAQAKEMMENYEVTIVDVREQSEYDAGHIENAILLPLGQIETQADTVLLDKDATILVYCRSGNRSREGAKKLVSLGYTNVYEMGGIQNWQNQGYKVV